MKNPPDPNALRRVALVTGASQGIGEAVARLFVSRGVDVMLTSRNIARLQALRSELAGCEARVESYPCDVAVTEQVCELVNEVAQKFGHLDFLVNNAGIGRFEPLEAVSDEQWENTLAVNLTGIFKCCRAALPLLRRGSNPVIVNNASIAALTGFPNNTAYSASKGGVVAFSNSLREELRGEGIRVGVICAGATDSSFWNSVEGEWDRSRMMAESTVAESIVNMALMPAGASVEQIVLMPSGGPL